jgi:hypothetical protein
MINANGRVKSSVSIHACIAVALVLMASQLGAANPGPYLIQWQQTYTRDSKGVDTTTPSYFASNLSYIDTLPFDGTVFNHVYSYQIMHSAPVNETALAAQFASLANVTPVRFVNNFALVSLRKPADFFGDWTVPVANFRAIARVCKNAGLRGIMFDDEEYANQYDTMTGGRFSVNIWNWPDDVSDKTRSLAEYQAQAQLRGKQIMDAMVQEYPGILVFVAHGAGESDPTIEWWYGKPDEKYELKGGFIAGLVEGAIADGQIIDGGEWNYADRTADEFDISYEYSKHWLPSAWVNCAFLPPNVRAIWPSRVSVGTALYNLAFGGRSMDPTIMQSCVANTLRRCDSHVFQYTEGMAWYEPGKVSQAWKDAIANGRADAVAAGRWADVTYSFADLAAGDGVAVDGNHSGLGFGSGKWVADSTGPGGLTSCARLAGSSDTSGTVVLPAGRWLKAVTLCAGSAVNVTVSDSSVSPKRNASRTISLSANVPYKLVTGWTYPGQTVTISVSAAGRGLVVDDLRFLPATALVPPTPFNLRVVAQ